MYALESLQLVSSFETVLWNFYCIPITTSGNISMEDWSKESTAPRLIWVFVDMQMLPLPIHFFGWKWVQNLLCFNKCFSYVVGTLSGSWIFSLKCTLAELIKMMRFLIFIYAMYKSLDEIRERIISENWHSFI